LTGCRQPTFNPKGQAVKGEWEPKIALTATAVQRELILTGQRLGENDNWIAGFCRYYGQPIISRDGAFDRVRGLRRLDY